MSEMDLGGILKTLETSRIDFRGVQGVSWTFMLHELILISCLVCVRRRKNIVVCYSYILCGLRGDLCKSELNRLAY